MKNAPHGARFITDVITIIMKKRLILSIARSIVFFAIPAYADVIVQQTNSSTLITTDTTGQVKMGTGLSGTIASGQFALGRIFGSGDTSFTIVCYTSILYLSECGGTGNGNISLHVEGSTITSPTKDFYTNDSITVNGQGLSAADPYTFDPTKYYAMGNTMINQFDYYGSSNDLKDLYYVISDSQINTVTKIYGLTPSPDSSVATSTSFAFGANGYVMPEDWSNDTVLYIRWRQQTGMGLRGNSTFQQGGDMTIPITSDGLFNLSTTTTILNSGIYEAYAAIQKPRFTIFGFGILTRTVTSVVWKFEVATSSDSEKRLAKILIQTTGIGGTQASSTDAIDSTSCGWGDFSISECISLLFFPSVDDVKDQLTTFKDGMLTRFPIGYVTRALTIMTGFSTTTLPAISVNIPIGEPGSLAYTHPAFTLDIQGMLQGGSDLLNTVHTTFGEDQTFREASEPFVQLSIALALIMFVIRDILRMRQRV